MDNLMHAGRNVAAVAAILGALFLGGCGGGGDNPVLSDDEIDRIQSNPGVQRLEGILERADTLLMPAIHQHLTISAAGQSESDRLVERFSCAGTRCVGDDGTIFSEADFLDLDTDVNLTDLDLGSRGGFDTIVIKGMADFPDSLEGITIDRAPAGQTYGFWGEYGWAAVTIFGGQFSGTADGSPFSGNMRTTAGNVVGDANSTSPTGTGNATWSGIAEAVKIDTDTFQRRQGSATVTIDDLSRPRVDVDIIIDGASIGSSAWTGMPLENGRFSATGPARLAGDFHGPDHGESYGVFDTTGYIGVFGAKRNLN